MRFSYRCVTMAVVAVLAAQAAARGQTPANDPSTRLKQVLPAPVAARVLATIAKARSRDLPAEALENRALKFAAKGVDPNAIDRSVAEQEVRMEQVRDALQQARNRKPLGDEIEAGAEAMRKGLDGAKVGALAKSAPSDRSLAVPLYVVGSLVDRGLSSNAALQRVQERLKLRASDHDLEQIANEAPGQERGANRDQPAETERDLAKTKSHGAVGNGQGGSAGGPPSGVPANGGKHATPPGLGKKPTTPPGKKP